MSKRHDDALLIQAGASNLAGVTRTLVAAIDEARAECVQPEDDEAVRLMIHQIASVANINENWPNTEYNRCLEHCRCNSERIQKRLTVFAMVQAIVKTSVKHANESTLRIEFAEIIHTHQSGVGHGLLGTIDMEFGIRITCKAARVEKGWIPLSHGFCGEPRTKAKEYLTSLAAQIQDATAEYVAVVFDGDPDLF